LYKKINASYTILSNKIESVKIWNIILKDKLLLKH
jgi:hypothetical protein